MPVKMDKWVYTKMTKFSGQIRSTIVWLYFIELSSEHLHKMSEGHLDFRYTDQSNQSTPVMMIIII